KPAAIVAIQLEPIVAAQPVAQARAAVARRRKPAAIVAVQLEPPSPSPAGRASQTAVARRWKPERRRCFLRLQPPSLTAVSQRRSLIAAAELQRRRCFLRR
ncbi:unnamed protein product, partial [Cuscuta campestris]